MIDGLRGDGWILNVVARENEDGARTGLPRQVDVRPGLTGRERSHGYRQKCSFREVCGILI